MKKLILILPLLLACDLSNESKEVISYNSKTSNCEGFKTLSKIKATDYQQDTIDYCSAEKLRWEYFETNKMLSLFHTRNKQNCGAKLDMSVTRNGDSYIVEEKNNGNNNLDCLCYFDTYCEVPNVEKTNILINIESQDYNIDLSKTNGVIVIDSSSSWPCLGKL